MFDQQVYHQFFFVLFVVFFFFFFFFFFAFNANSGIPIPFVTMFILCFCIKSFVASVKYVLKLLATETE